MEKTRTRLALLVAAAAAGLGLAGLTLRCDERLSRSGAAPVPDPRPAPIRTEDRSPHNDPELAKTVPRRLVVLSPAIAEMVHALGAFDRVVGVTRFSTYPPGAGELPDIGGVMDINYETLARLEPDLILAQSSNERLRAFAEERGIGYSAMEIESIDGALFAVRRLGLYLGLREEGRALARRIRTELDAVRAETASAGAVPVLISVDRQPGALTGLLTAGRGTFVSELVELAGGRNVFADLEQLYPTVSKEAVVARAPEVILELKPGADHDSKEVARLLADWRLLGSSAAAKERRVVGIVHPAALTPGPRMAEVAREIARALHPEIAWEERR